MSDLTEAQQQAQAALEKVMNCRFSNFDAGAVIHWAERGFYQVKAEAASRISQQDAELERLREALKPFALAATIFEQEYGDRMKSDTGCNIKFAVLCQARDALRANAEETRT